MTSIPLGLKSYKRTNGFQPEVELVNLVLEQDDSGGSPDNVMRLQRPGLNAFTTLGGPIRGIFQTDQVLNGAWFAVNGNMLTRFLPDLAAIGSVTGSEPVSFAATFNAVYVLGGGQVHRWDGTTFSAIALPSDYPGTPISIETINSYLIIFCSTGRFYWLEPGTSVVDPLNFATAESSPDGGVAVTRLIDELFFGGTVSIEPWQPSGDLDAPFQKAGGRQFERGVLARDTMRRFDNSIVWVGEDLIVYRVGSVPTRISDHGIEERLRKRTASPTAWTFGEDGHKYYALRIPGQGTFVYDAASGGVWSEFRTPGRSVWAAHVGASSPAYTLAGDSDTSAIYRIDASVATDAGVAFPRIVSATVPLVGRGGRNDSFSISIGVSANCVVKVRWRDGNEPYPDYYEEMPAEAGANILNVYRLGSVSQPFRTFEVLVEDPVLVRISGAVVNEAYQ